MGCHAGALALSALAYWFARTRARHAAFTFGTGKVHALAGYTNAVILIIVALLAIIESVRRLVHPHAIDFREAVPVAIIGLIVNIVCVRLLHDDEHDHPEDHDHPRDHNLRAAYLHVLGDLITSVAAVLALLGARYLGLPALDPVMAFVSSLVVLRWGYQLCRGASRHLLDIGSAERAHAIREMIEQLDDSRVVDLHLWELGPKRLGCIVSIMTSRIRPLDDYRQAIRAVAPVDHITVEVGKTT
jgi:cation diffusion facilitator family transporter